jgi:hypothetical protein
VAEFFWIGLNRFQVQVYQAFMFVRIKLLKIFFRLSRLLLSCLFKSLPIDIKELIESKMISRVGSVLNFVPATSFFSFSKHYINTMDKKIVEAISK